jgi:hypothetical protein
MVLCTLNPEIAKKQKNKKKVPKKHKKIVTIAYKFERELQIFTTLRFIFVYFHMLKIVKFGYMYYGLLPLEQHVVW